MNVNIKDSVNVQKLKKAIDCYVSTKLCTPDFYLIMNSGTKDALLSECCDKDRAYHIDKNYDEFNGIPIAICNKLPFGEVDIK